MARLVLQVAARLVGALLLIAGLHTVVFLSTGRTAGSIATACIWAAAMYVGFLIPLRLITAYKARLPKEPPR